MVIEFLLFVKETIYRKDSVLFELIFFIVMKYS